ncbi:MAG: glutamate-1-semialdehyde-2,1-aminomutase [Firmicutes bacterium]|nr:glutamate-1-semialdehyde-2,1-aminomutase [Bacillota bacterium]MBO2520199.1 glutamate-1-semialdehyde-2,1-aminomutase [Bacillota bacterium]
MNFHRSEELFRRALARIAGGVNSPSRSYAAVGGGAPAFIARGEGAYLYDADGNRYIDYLAAYGAMILGHAHPKVVKAVQEAVTRGSVYGAPTEAEVRMAEAIHEAIPQMELVRFTASGTEAVMTALRVARGYTGREKILKFDGAYHGHSDPVLVSAGSGSSTLGIDESLGVPRGVAQDVISIPYNDTEKLEEAFSRHGNEIACALLEPVTGNFGIVEPTREFMEAVHRLARAHGSLVIWDEVITAFRFQYGSIGQYFGLEADLYTLGKVIGGGLPIGAYGGRKEVMSVVAPLGGVYQDGTLSGNPVSMAAGLACLEALREDPGLYSRLDRLAAMLAQGMQEAAHRHGITLSIGRFKGALSPFFLPRPASHFAEAEQAPSGHLARFFRLLLERGIMTAPSKYEAWFISAAHTERDIEITLEAVDDAFRQMAAEGYR